MEKPEIRILSTGYITIRWNGECWAQIPADFQGEVIPDEFIFHPEWNRGRINSWWRQTLKD